MSTTQTFRARRRLAERARPGERRLRGRRPRPPRRRPSSLALLAVACVVVAALSLLFPSTPTYDPWAWIIWGREIAELELSTTYGPSWKPLPVVFTTLFATTGDAAPALWLVVARAGTLLALVAAFRMAKRLAGPGLPGLFAGAVAGGGLLLTTDWIRHGGLGNSEGLLVALVVLAVERHVDGARRAAFGLGFAAALLRPEIWPFLGLYGSFLWVREPAARRLVVALLVLVPALWFLPELWGSGDPLRASSRAQQDLRATSPALSDNPTREVVRLARELVIDSVELAAVAAVAGAALLYWRRRRDGAVLALALGTAAWIGIVAAMTEAGYSGNPRYLVLAVSLACVLAGVAVARASQGIAHLASRLTGERLSRLPSLVAAAAALALVALALPDARPRVEHISDQVEEMRFEARRNANVDNAVRLAGGRDRVLGCGDVFTGPYQVPVVAWALRIHFSEVDYEPVPPGTIFRARPRRGGRPAPEEVPPFALVGGTREWVVFAACPGGASVGG